MADDLLHYIDGKKATPAAAEKALAKAEKDGSPVRYDTVIPDKALNEQDRVLAAVNVLGSATATEVAGRMNAAVDLYDGLNTTTVAAVKAHLDGLAIDGRVEKAGSRFKAAET